MNRRLNKNTLACVHSNQSVSLGLLHKTFYNIAAHVPLLPQPEGGGRPLYF
jgi:hypothetical protein